MAAAAHDFDELVDLHALSRTFEKPEAITSKIATLPLRDAISLVVEDWADDKFRQLSAVIVRKSAPAIRTLDEIKHLYAQVDTTPASCPGQA